ncbi:MAG TPA: bifunctional diaminohydroxyphosphoribosylaminopyrimidine deaminase/5-amino-6-(5-phosphoribosylamino)uracil reductase RibD [Steroidobacteraceae bacterium]|nr:bifunctional diaminohydroxyphosphoribosylaminopyrimidine deaminase/5-amino-6-(5-phosphoribosylamino)uracil reductase RibD [Steroidobacteraceae bacterium]
MPAAATPDDERMAAALRLATLGLYTTDPNPRVGCVLVQGGRVVGEGWHRRAGEPHAEVLALRAAGAEARGATAYVTLEPCSHTGRTPPCTDALIEAGVARVACSSVDPNPRVAGAGFERLRAAGIEVAVGSLAAAARALNVGFFSRFERSRPYLRLKLAISLDARTAHAGGRKAWISGEASRADVQEWRARSSAILTGAGTVRADDPRLDVRLPYGPWVRQPLRIVLDPDMSCAADAKIFRGDGALIFAAADAGAPPRGWGAARVERVARTAAGLDLQAIGRRLAELEVNELLVECGPRLAGALLQARLVDELLLYVAPILLGADAPPLAELRQVDDGQELPRFELAETHRLGEDLRLRLRPKAIYPCSPES